jgi:hypothetical protein
MNLGFARTPLPACRSRCQAIPPAISAPPLGRERTEITVLGASRQRVELTHGFTVDESITVHLSEEIADDMIVERLSTSIPAHNTASSDV